MDKDDVKAVLLCSTDNCDAGRALRRVLVTLAEANLQEAEEEGSAAEYERKSEATTALFLLATAITNGRRWPTEET